MNRDDSIVSPFLQAEDEGLEAEQKPVLAAAITDAIKAAKAARKAEKDRRLKQARFRPSIN